MLEEEPAVVPDVAAVEVEDHRTVATRAVLDRAQGGLDDPAVGGCESSARRQPAAIPGPQTDRHERDRDDRDEQPTRGAHAACRSAIRPPRVMMSSFPVMMGVRGWRSLAPPASSTSVRHAGLISSVVSGMSTEASVPRPQTLVTSKPNWSDVSRCSCRGATDRRRHATILQPPHVRVLAEKLEPFLRPA